MKKYQVEKSYNYYKRQYRNYLLLVKRKNKYITYKVDSRIVSFLFQIDSVEELVFDQILFMELLELKERLTLNKKTNIYKVRNGFTFLRYLFFIKKGKLVTRIMNKVKVRIKRKIRN